MCILALVWFGGSFATGSRGLERVVGGIGKDTLGLYSGSS